MRLTRAGLYTSHGVIHPTNSGPLELADPIDSVMSEGGQVSVWLDVSHEPETPETSLLEAWLRSPDGATRWVTLFVPQATPGSGGCRVSFAAEPPGRWELLVFAAPLDRAPNLEAAETDPLFAASWIWRQPPDGEPIVRLPLDVD